MLIMQWISIIVIFVVIGIIWFRADDEIQKVLDTALAILSVPDIHWGEEEEK